MNFDTTFSQESMADDQDYVELGLKCADICKALDREKMDDLSRSVCEAINQLTVWVELGV